MKVNNYPSVLPSLWGSSGGSVGKESTYNAEDKRDPGSILGS